MQKQFKLLIRTDADIRIGIGHLIRCLALAQAWQERGGDVTFLSHCDSETLRQRIIDEGFDFIPIEKPHPDPSDLTQALNILKRHAPCSMPHALWFVVDGYHFTPDYQKTIRENGYRLLAIDDMAHMDHYHADILLNQNILASTLHYSCDRDTVKLLGCEYVLLRREFLKYRAWKREIPEKASKILVTMGGSDPDNVTLKVVRALNSLNDPNLEVRIIAGPSNPNKEILINAMRHAPCPMLCVENASNMADLMAWADVAISAGGSTCWELAFMELPNVLLVLAENQGGIAEGLNRAGVGMNLGWYEQVSTRNLIDALESLLQSSERCHEMSRLGRLLIDGDGSDRVVEQIQRQADMIGKKNARSVFG